ncbi:hypothetical protein FQN55_000170 [Onygenales sp. PD_40]|nr:hypothetical protein FQN55_000170 [Onygenales sp. PD_40]
MRSALHTWHSLLVLTVFLFANVSLAAIASEDREKPSTPQYSSFGDIESLWQNLPRCAETNWEPLGPESLQDSDKLFIVDRLIPPQTIIHFFEFTMRGTLPNGKNTTLPLFQEDEVAFLSNPYSESAAQPHNEIFGPAIGKIMMRIGSDEDPDRLTIVEKPIHAMKSRLWEGIVPLSETQWREKQLSNPENFQYTFEYLEAVIRVFDYLNHPDQVENLRTTFNLISEHLVELEGALNPRRQADGKEPLSLAALWEEYIRIHYQVMTDRAHSWVISHINTLMRPLLDAVHEYPNLTSSADTLSAEQSIQVGLLYRLSGLAAEAEYTILMPMEGYAGYTAPERPLYLHGYDLFERRLTYQHRLKFMKESDKISEEMMESLSFNIDKTDEERAEEEANKPNLIFRTIDGQIRRQEKIRGYVRGVPEGEPEPLPPPGWIRDTLIKSKEAEDRGEPIETVGFVIYRLARWDDEAKWADIKARIEEDLADWGDGIEGAESIKPLLKIHWFDGKKLGIAENDIEEAKRHFNAFLDSPTFSTGLSTTVFLAIDHISQITYNTLGAASSPTGILLAIDPYFDEAVGLDRPDESPGYTGRMHISTNLVWPELFAMNTAQSDWLEDLWPLAMRHSRRVYMGRRVYVGYVVPEMVRGWEGGPRGAGGMGIDRDLAGGLKSEQRGEQEVFGEKGRGEGVERDGKGDGKRRAGDEVYSGEGGIVAAVQVDGRGERHDEL